MKTFHFNHLDITLDKTGAAEFTKASYPVRYGRFNEITTNSYLYQYNLNGELKHIQGRKSSWPHPSEWLKRTVGNDWIYYWTGSYDDIFDLFGEYYIPCLSYPSNGFIGTGMFANRALQDAIASSEAILEQVKDLNTGSKPLGDFLARFAGYSPAALKKRTRVFHAIIGGPITVLPPDVRHVDYEVIPVIAADGCLYHCGFCRIKTGRRFKPRSRTDILNQIKALKIFFDRDIKNYNSVFIGQHDALNAGKTLLEFTAVNAYKWFDFEHSHLKGANLFLFGSVDSILKAEDGLFSMLDGLPFYTYINLGLESADPETLSRLQKPISADAVGDAFAKMIDINKRYNNIEITANIVLGKNLPQSHLTSMLKLTRESMNHFYSKASIYISPLSDGQTRRETLAAFAEIKRLSRVPTYLYLIQRL